jgi:uncharacterized protein YbgA (DUF1722 family)/uncharacterized protein YbbK (DUF523 family)
MIKVGVSACVLGDKVRFDGGHKKSDFVSASLHEVFQLLPVCPEVGMGMSVPRPTIRVTEIKQGARLTDSKDISIDHTDKLHEFVEQKISLLDQIDGYILAAKSPTCGIYRIKTYNDKGDLLHRNGRGLFAGEVMERYPNLPVEEDGRLNDTGLRESFITRVYVHHEFRTTVLTDPSSHKLVKFHSRHKFLVMAYSNKAYQQLGRLVAQVGSSHLDTCLKQYLSLLMQVLSKPTDRKKHTNVLMHLQGFFKKSLDKQDKQELSEQIDKYRRGYLPLMAPITLLMHYLKKYPNPYLSEQVYLKPYPEELGLRA